MVTMAATAHKEFFEGASHPSFFLRVSVHFLAGTLACLPTATLATEWKVAPRLALSETYSDNILLAPSGSKKSEWVTQVNPGVSIEGSGADLRVSADYSLQNLIYANDSRRNNFFHQLNANANATLVDNTLFLDASGGISQQATSLLGPSSNQNLNPGNVTDVSNYSVSPYLLHRFGSAAVGQLRFTHDAVSSGAGGLSDSSADRVDFRLNSGASFRDLGWGITYTDEKVDYDLRQDVESKVFTGTASYPVQPKLRVVATAGYEKNNFTYLAGQEPKGSFWSAGLSWAPTTQTNVDASVGERYFGKTYALGLNHRTAQTTWIANYSQNVTSTRQDSLNPQILIGALNLKLINILQGTPISDQQALQQSTELAILKGVPLQLLTNQYYLSKQLLGSVAIHRGKSLVTLTATHSVRESVETTTLGTDSFSAVNNVKQYGLSAQWAMQMSPRDTINLGAGLTRSVFPDISRTDDTGNITLGVTRKLEKKLNGSLGFRHSLRTSNDSQNEYTENAITGKLLWTW